MQAIGCITLVWNRNGQMMGVPCSKGRGMILPGGKWESGETFVDAARREFLEETGLEAENFELIFQAPDGFGFHCMCFVAHVRDFDLRGNGEMTMKPVTWAELKRSTFAAYYELLEMAVAKWEKKLDG